MFGVSHSQHNINNYNNSNNNSNNNNHNMSQQKQKLTICSIITLVAFAVTVQVHADLRVDLREFLKLLPRRRIGYIAARHFILDAEFRQAVGYIRSDEFSITWQQIRQTQELKQIVDYMQKYGSGYDVSNAIDKIPNELRSWEIPSKVPVNMMLQRNFTTFLHEVVQSLTRAKIASWLSRKVREGGEFALLYKALRDLQFQQLVNKARTSKNLAAPLAELKRHSIDVNELVAIGFEVLEWGP